MLAIVLIKGGKWSFANVPSLLKYLMYISIVNRFVCFRTRVTLPFQNCQSFLRGKARFTYIAPVAPCREDPSRQDATGQCDFWTDHNAGFIDHYQDPLPLVSMRQLLPTSVSDQLVTTSYSSQLVPTSVADNGNSCQPSRNFLDCTGNWQCVRVEFFEFFLYSVIAFRVIHISIVTRMESFLFPRGTS